jgi:hypothetical protein
MFPCTDWLCHVRIDSHVEALEPCGLQLLCRSAGSNHAIAVWDRDIVRY